MGSERKGAIGRRVASGIALVFGGLSIVSGGAALFGGAAAQEVAGAVVPFVLWFNFLSGFVYVLAGTGMAMDRRWGDALAIALAVAIGAVFAALGWHISQGGAFEMRTVGAMVLRLAVWVGIAAYVNRQGRQDAWRG